MTDKAFVGILLAAGTSSRFGSPKQLLPFGDTTLLGQTVRNANASTLDRVVVVLGRSSHKIGKSIQFDRAQVVDNTGFGTGCAPPLFWRASRLPAIVRLLCCSWPTSREWVRTSSTR